MTVESRDAFVFAACCEYADCLARGTWGDARGEVAVLALRPRDPDGRLFCLARGRGTFRFNDCVVHYRVDSSEPLPTDTRPEPYRQLHLEAACDRQTLLDFVSQALSRHRARVSEPRGLSGSGVMRYVWDEDAQCWDAGRLVPKRPPSSLFLPPGVLDDALCDLQAYLEPRTRTLHAALHVAPTRVYLLRGPPGSAKTSTLHCLASEVGHSLAVLNFTPRTSDEDVRAALRTLPDNCLVCIEDIDCLFDRRGARNHGVNFSALLAALDGAFARCGSTEPLTVLLTTNSLESLDVALRRRVDYAIEFGHATRQQCRDMFAAYMPTCASFDAVWAHVGRHTFTTSVFAKFLLRALQQPHRDPLRCLPAFDDLVACTYAGEGAPSYVT